MSFDGPILVLAQSDVEVSVQLKHNLPHLEDGYILANATTRAKSELWKEIGKRVIVPKGRMGCRGRRSRAQISRQIWESEVPCWRYAESVTYSKHVSLHILDVLLVTLDPPLRPELMRIMTKDVLVVVKYPGVDANYSALGQTHSVERYAALRHLAFENEARGRMDAHRFVDDGRPKTVMSASRYSERFWEGPRTRRMSGRRNVQVWQLGSFGVGDRVGGSSLGDGGFDLFFELLPHRGMLSEVIEDRRD